MSAVFLSYAHSDEATALLIERGLRGAGYHVFRDQDSATGIPGGMSWAKELFDALDRVDVVVFLGSLDSLMSSWCHTEIAVAVARGRHVVQVSTSDVGVHPVLSERQALSPEGSVADLTAHLLSDLSRAGFPPVPTNSWDPARSPFPGLRQIPSDFSPVFFGRDREISVIVDRVTAPQPAPTLVVGASGCGKSSLVRAGVMARLDRRPDMLVLPVVEPGSNPISRFALSLAELEPTLDLHRMISDPLGIADAVDRLTARGQRLVACIDQAEDLLTAVERDRAGDFVARVAQADRSRLSLLVVLRSASMEAWGRDARFSDMSPNDPVWVRPLDRSNLRQVVVGPARAAGIRIEPTEMVEEILDDVGDGRALPLLAALLEELAEGHSRTQPVVINRARYQRVGPVERVIERRAEAAAREIRVMHGLTEQQVVDAYLRLADVDEDQTVTRTEVAVDTLPPEARDAFDVFERHRLVIRDRRVTAPDALSAGSAVEVVTATHEVVFRAWPALAEAIRTRLHDLELRTRLRREAEQWARTGQGVVGLTGGRLDQALTWRLGHPHESSMIVDRFLDAARQQRRRRRVLTLTAPALGAAVFIVGLVAVVLYQQVQTVARAQRTTEAVRLASEAQSVAMTRPDLSMLLALEAAQRGGDPRAEQAPFVALSRGPGPRSYQQLPVRPDVGAMSADGTRAIVVGPTSTVEWDAESGRVVGNSKVLFKAVAISGDGSTVALADTGSVSVRPWGGDGESQLCQIVGGQTEILKLSETGDQLVAVVVDRAGPATSTVLVGSTDSCDARVRHQVRGLISDVAIGAAGDVVALSLRESSGSDSSPAAPRVELIDTAKGRVTARLLGGPHDFTAVATSDGEVAALDDMGDLRVWRPPGVTPVWQGRAFDAVGDAVLPLPAASEALGSSGTKWLAAAGDGQMRVMTMGANTSTPALVGLPPLGDPADPEPVALATRTGGATVLDRAGRMVTWSLDTATAFDTGVLSSYSLDHIAPLSDGSVVAAGAAGTWLVDSQGQSSRLAAGGGVVAAEGDTWAIGLHSGEVVVGTSRPSDLSSVPRSIGRVHTDPVAIAVVDGDEADTPNTGSTRRFVLVEGDGQVTAFGEGAAASIALGQALGGKVLDGVASGRWLYLGLRNGRVAVVDLAAPTTSTGAVSPEALRTYAAHSQDGASAVAVSHDGALLATGGDDRKVIVWDVSDGELRPRPALIGHDDRVRALAFSPDGRELASASEDLSVMRWDPKLGERVGEPVPVSAVADVAYALAGDPTLEVASSGVSSWPLDPREWFAVACQVLGGRTLSEAERRQILGGSRPEARCPRLG